MSMRSATNKRTLEHEYTGATRKGASSAKPARAAAGSVRVVPASAKARRKAAERGENLEGLSKEEKRARKREERAREDRLYDASSVLLKADEDYNKYRKIFWAILGVGMAAIVVTWYVLLGGQQDHVGQSGNPLEIVGIVVSYAAIIGAFVRQPARDRGHCGLLRGHHRRLCVRYGEDPPHPQLLPLQGRGHVRAQDCRGPRCGLVQGV